MARNIKQLDDKTINKIAAGEVVERPSSVVKELVENSIDAGASSIIIEIKLGGKKYIRITDDGSGIARDDLGLAFLRHSTSKISTVEDLEIIKSLGFRGEALASISAVSLLEIVTKTTEDVSGIQANLKAGEIDEKKEVGCPTGTTIIVKNLFYNVPVREKFLKSDNAEASQISNIVYKLALSNPKISFKYIKDNKMILKTPGNGNIQTTIYSLFGKEFTKSLFDVDYYGEGINIKGAISNPSFTRGNRGHQYIFVNGRYIKDTDLSKAVEDAYKSLIPINRFPVFILFIDIDSSQIDVNVHPTKTEIRFDQSNKINSIVNKVVTGVLQGENLIPEVTIRTKKKKNNEEQKNFIDKVDTPKIDSKMIETKKVNTEKIDTVDYKKQDIINNKPKTVNNNTDNYDISYRKIHVIDRVNKKPQKSKNIIDNVVDTLDNYGAKSKINEAFQIKEDSDIVKDTVSDGLINKPIDNIIDNSIEDDFIDKSDIKNKHRDNDLEVGINNVEKILKEEEAKKEIIIEKEKINEKKNILPNLDIIGSLFDTYILAQDKINEVFYLIDQHAAHERVMYEKLRNQFNSENTDIQELLAPEIIELTHSEVQLVNDNLSTFKKIGFLIESFGINSIILRGVPIVFGEPDSKKLFLDILDKLNSNVSSRYDLRVEKIMKMACTSAIKAGYNIKGIEINKLIDDLKCAKEPFTCPHGRPIIIKMTKYELEKKFKRVQ